MLLTIQVPPSTLCAEDLWKTEQGEKDYIDLEVLALEHYCILIWV